MTPPQICEQKTHAEMASAPNPNPPMSTPSLDPSPKSFKMDRRSPEAANLRLAVAEKLLDYLGKYSDDVLAEYIVVLVCNGKNQIQACLDLQAFLGEESENFVIWLWDHLSKQTIASGPSINHSDHKIQMEITHATSVGKDQGTSRHNCDVEASDFQSSKEHPEFSNFSMGPSFLETTDNLKRFHQHSSMDVPTDKAKAKRLEIKSLVVHDELGAKEDENRDRAQTSMHSVMKHSSDTLHGDEKHLQYERQHQKIAKRNPGAVPYRSLRVPKEELIARNLQTVEREITASRSVLITRTAAMDVDESRINRPRGCVWDRLGRPVDGDYIPPGEGNNKHSHKFSNSRNVRHHSEDLRESKSSVLEQDAQKFTSLDDGCARVSSNNYRSKYENHRCDEHGSVNDFGKLKRKKRYGNTDSVNSSATFSECGEECIRDKYPKKQNSLPIKYDHYRKADGLLTEIEGTTAGELVHAAKSSTPDPTSRSFKVVPAQVDEKTPLGTLNQDSNSTDKIEAHLVVGAARNNNSTPTTDVMLDVKEKLLQVERDMIKIRAKQANIGILKNTGSTGPHNDLEDVDSRTVLVTNVHFAASREALSNHFKECGPIAKVTLLNDPVTAKPKGAAYIVFVSKESADRAISCSGSSFFSRLLKVMRKAEVPPGFLLSTQAVVRPQQSLYPQFHPKGFLQRNQMSSHLQWRRNDSISKGNSLSACADGLQSSNNGK